MKLLKSTVLYIALALGANTLGALPALADVAAAEALREGDMKKLNFHSAPKPVSQTAFATRDGAEGTLADYAGKVTVVNFWATWCAPCRKEMPMLADLQREMGEQINVVTIATGRNPPPAIDAFFDEIGVDNLPRHRDPKQQIAREMAVMGLPVTIILDAEGRELARLLGDADWNSPSAKAILAALAEGD